MAGHDEDAVAVAILAGGRSRRMGRDKALLPWGRGQMIDRMVEIARRLPDTRETFIIGDRPEYHGRGAVVAADRYPGAGPLGGIATALLVAPAPRVLVLAGDLPLAADALLAAMVRYPSTADALVPVVERPSAGQGGESTYQTLLAIYSVACLRPIERRIERNELQVAGLFEEVTVETLGEAWLRAWDPELESFENANTPEDLERIRRVARMRRGAGSEGCV